jgi:hypothetical protein
VDLDDNDLLLTETNQPADYRHERLEENKMAESLKQGHK